MFRIEFPADRHDIALAVGAMLMQIGSGSRPAHEPKVKPDVPSSLITDESDLENDDPDEVDSKQAFASTEPTETVSKPATGSIPDVDEKGVPFDDKYCAVAKDPFYASGKEKGQWKTRKGVAKDAYDTWYAGQLAKIKTKTPPADDNVVNASEAFGKTKPSAGQTAQTAETGNAPTTAGEIMRWISEKQAAGHLTQDDVGAAYATIGRTGIDLFGQDKDRVAETVSMLHAALVAMAGD